MNDALTPSLTAWVARRRQAILVTSRADGTAQTSNVATAFDAAGGCFRVSVTADRAKTRNLRRDPRASLHVLGPDFGSYLSLRVSAELTSICADPSDSTADELLEVYEAITGAEHPDRAEFRSAMVAERRLILRLRPGEWSGRGLPGQTP